MIADSVGDGGLPDQMVPFLDGVLTGDDGSRLSVAILDDLEKIFAFGIGQRGDKQIIEDKQLDFGESGKGF